MSDAEGTLTAASKEAIKVCCRSLDIASELGRGYALVPRASLYDVLALARLGLAAQQGADPLHAAAREVRDANVVVAGLTPDEAEAAVHRYERAKLALIAAALAAAERATDSTS